jgi:hypothetical protein
MRRVAINSQHYQILNQQPQFYTALNSNIEKFGIAAFGVEEKIVEKQNYF